MFNVRSVVVGALASPAPEGGDLASPQEPPPPAAPSPATGGKPCVCGHARQAHEHYRRGKDCALCSCVRYRRRLIRRRGR